MALTQIGSLNIGDLTDDITIEKASGVYSRYGNIVHITDGKTDQILAIARSEEGGEGKEGNAGGEGSVEEKKEKNGSEEEEHRAMCTYEELRQWLGIRER